MIPVSPDAAAALRRLAVMWRLITRPRPRLLALLDLTRRPFSSHPVCLWGLPLSSVILLHVASILVVVFAIIFIAVMRARAGEIRPPAATLVVAEVVVFPFGSALEAVEVAVVRVLAQEDIFSRSARRRHRCFVHLRGGILSSVHVVATVPHIDSAGGLSSRGARSSIRSLSRIPELLRWQHNRCSEQAVHVVLVCGVRQEHLAPGVMRLPSCMRLLRQREPPSDEFELIAFAPDALDAAQVQISREELGARCSPRPSFRRRHAIFRGQAHWAQPLRIWHFYERRVETRQMPAAQAAVALDHDVLIGISEEPQAEHGKSTSSSRSRLRSLMTYAQSPRRNTSPSTFTSCQ